MKISARVRHSACALLIASTVLFGSIMPPLDARAQSDPWFGRDKALHFTATFVLSGAGYALGTGLLDSRDYGTLIGTSLGLGAGAGKELLDLAGMGHASWKDFAWSAAGTAVGLVVTFLIDLAARGWKTRPDSRAWDSR